MVSCKICYKHKSTVLIMFLQKKHLLSVCSEYGTVSRTEILNTYLKSSVHKECVKTEQLSKLSTSEVNDKAPIDKLMSQQNKTLDLKIGQLMYTVYNDVENGKWK